MAAISLFEQQDADLENIASFWEFVPAEKWRGAVMSVIAPFDAEHGTMAHTKNAAECRFAVAEGKFYEVLSEIVHFCKLRGIEVTDYNIAGRYLDVAVSPGERAMDAAVYIEMINGECAEDFLLTKRTDAWAAGEAGSSTVVLPAGVSVREIKERTAEYIIAYMAQVVGEVWRGGRACVQGFRDFLDSCSGRLKGRDSKIIQAVKNNIDENEQMFKGEAPERYLKRVENSLQNPDSPYISLAEYAWATRQLSSAQCRFKDGELHINVRLDGASNDIVIVPYDLGPNTERVKVTLGVDSEGSVDVGALGDILIQLKGVLAQT